MKKEEGGGHLQNRGDRRKEQGLWIPPFRGAEVKGDTAKMD